VNDERTLEDTLAIVDKYIVKRYATHHALDDLRQEAQIFAWKDYQAGDHDSKGICVRAAYRVLALIGKDKPDSKAQWTGHIECKEGQMRNYAAGEASRDKIRMYVTDYTKLHGHSPSVAEVAKNLGMNRQNVNQHMQRLYTFTTQGKYTESPLETGFTEGSTEETHSVADSVRYGYTFENELIHRLDTYALMVETLDERERTWTYMHVFMGRTHGEIADQYGYSRNMVSIVVRKSMTKLKEAIGE
jgi:DNA-binding CsgD family transcriptional regulator